MGAVSAINRSVVAGPQGGVSQAEPKPLLFGEGTGAPSRGRWPWSRTEVAEELGADGPGQGREEGSACSLVGGGGGSAVVTYCCPFAPPCPQTACLNSQGFEIEKGGSEESRDSRPLNRDDGSVLHLE